METFLTVPTTTTKKRVESPNRFIRSRNNSISLSEEMNSGFFEEELFRRCKNADTDPKATSGILLSEMEMMGILSDDPRIAPLIEALKEIQLKSGGKIYSINNIKLDYNQFSKVVRTCKCLICDVMEGNVVIPEFDDFCQDLRNIFERCGEEKGGLPAQYIPQLARGDPTKWGMAVCTTDGQRFHLGDSKDLFSIQSTSKPFTYGLCLEELGNSVVQQYIGREPSGRQFNEIVMDYNGQPHNPMINSGAIMSAALLLYLVKPEMSISEKYEMLEKFFRRMAGGKSVGFQNSVFLSERESADRNHALAYYMREGGCFPDGPRNEGGGVDIKDILDFYFQACSLELNCESMSIMAATLAAGGTCPITGEKVLADAAVRNILSLMYSCGMYNYSGQFAFQVGLPAKSGVSGVVIVVVPGVAGFATWSPPLDNIGNSVRGVRFCEELINLYNFHTFDNNLTLSQQRKKDPRAGRYEDRCLQVVKLLLAGSHGDKRALERAYLSGFDMNLGDYDNRTALHLACSEGHIACVRFLIETCNVDIQVRDRWGNTPMEEAKKSNNMKVIAVLKKHMINRQIPSEEPISEEVEKTELIQGRGS